MCCYRSVDEYTEGSSFEIASLFKSIGTFVGIFLGSFLLGCFMGLATALVGIEETAIPLITASHHTHTKNMIISLPTLVDEVFKAEGLSFA